MNRDVKVRKEDMEIAEDFHCYILPKEREKETMRHRLHIQSPIRCL